MLFPRLGTVFVLIKSTMFFRVCDSSRLCLLALLVFLVGCDQEVSTNPESPEEVVPQEHQADAVMQEEEPSDDIAAEKEDCELPPFTLLDFSYAARLMGEMQELQELPVNPMQGQGRDVAFKAQNGDASAQYRVGLSMIAFNFHERDRVMQVRGSWLQQSAERGYLPAQKLMAYLYLNGYGSESPELSQALSWLNSASVQGDQEAQAEMLFLASQDLIEDEDALEAYQKLQSLAHSPVPSQHRYSAQVSLGLLAALGLGGSSRDVALSLHYFARARDFSRSATLSAIFAQSGLAEPDEAGGSWESELAGLAEQGDAEACYLYSQWLAEGLSSHLEEQDAEELQLRYLQSASEKGHADARFSLARMIYDPWVDDWDEADSMRLSAAMQLYEQADALGSTSAVSYLARCCEMAKDTQRAITLLRAAIERGGCAAMENRQQLVDLLMDEQRYQEACELYEEMASLNHKQAIIELATLYQEGEQTEKNPQRVKELLKRLDSCDPWYASHLRRKWMTR